MSKKPYSKKVAETTGIYTGAALGANIFYSIRSKAPSNVPSNLMSNAGTGFGLMGTMGTVKASTDLLGSLDDLNKKKRKK